MFFLTKIKKISEDFFVKIDAGCTGKNYLEAYNFPKLWFFNVGPMPAGDFLL